MYDNLQYEQNLIIQNLHKHYQFTTVINYTAFYTLTKIKQEKSFALLSLINEFNEKKWLSK